MKISAILRLFLLSVALSAADGKRGKKEKGGKKKKGGKKEKGGKKGKGKGIKSGETKYVSDDCCAFSRRFTIVAIEVMRLWTMQPKAASLLHYLL